MRRRASSIGRLCHPETLNRDEPVSSAPMRPALIPSRRRRDRSRGRGRCPGGRRRWVDVGLENLRGADLQVEREVTLTVVPKPVGQSVRLDRVEALEVEKGLGEALAGWVTLE